MITAAQLAENNGADGKALWVQIGTQVFDLTKFAALHPGGKAVLARHAGTDCTEQFKLFHNELVLPKYASRLPVVGFVGAATEAQLQDEAKRARLRQTLLDSKAVGSLVPFADPFWYQRSSHSPYYKPTHFKFRDRVRAFVDGEFLPGVEEWADSQRPPAKLMLRLGEEGFLAAMAGGPPFPARFLDAGTPTIDDFDYFHCHIVFDEFARCGNAAVMAAITNGAGIACSAILRYGSDELQRRVLPDVLMGRKLIALGVSEPAAGSDVSGLSTELRNVAGTAEAEVTGTKKWITNGTYAEWITLLAKDGDEGGMSLVLVPTDAAGFTSKKVNVRNSDVSGTALLDLDRVRVPRANIVGKRGAGWAMQMSAFNFERMYLVSIILRMSRCVLDECIRYALKREAFGVKLHEIQSVRMRVAEMIRDIESVAAWTEAVLFQMCALPHARAQVALGDVIASVKVQAALVYERCARHALHVFGGNAVQARGVGHKVEPALAQSKGFLIPAGAQDVMDDFAARQCFKLAKQVARL